MIKQYLKCLFCILIGVLISFFAFHLRYQYQLKQFQKEQKILIIIFERENKRVKRYEDKIREIEWHIRMEEERQKAWVEWNENEN